MGKHNIHIIEPFEEMYLARLSTRDVATLLCVSKSKIAKRLKSLGLTRSRSKAAILCTPWKPTTHWRSMRNRARKVYMRAHQVTLTPKQHVHHIDHDYTNNDITNLEVKDAGLHISHHHRGPYYGIPKHKQPPTIAYMKVYRQKYAARWRKGGRYYDKQA